MKQGRHLEDRGIRCADAPVLPVTRKAFWIRAVRLRTLNGS